MNVGLYVRVSTAEQANEGYSIGEQIERLEKYASAMNWTIYKIYQDPGYTGSNTDRPGLQEMVQAVKDRKLNKIVVYKLDRLSRSQLDTLYLIEKVFLNNNVDFVSMLENFDTSTPFGRAMIGILAVFAQLEREQIKERMSLGKEGRAKAGLFHGSGMIPIGYDYVDGKLIINEYEAMQLKMGADYLLKGYSAYKVESILTKKGYEHKYGRWTAKALRRSFRNKLYCGYISYKGKYYPGTHEPIFSEETFERLNDLLDQKSLKYEKTRRRNTKTLLSGLLYCTRCGSRFYLQHSITKNKRYLYYMCYGKHTEFRKLHNKSCDNKNYSMDQLDKIILDEIEKLKLDPNYIDQITSEHLASNYTNERIDVVKQEIEKIDNRLMRLMDLYTLGTISIDDIDTKVKSLNDTKSKLISNLTDLEKGLPKLTHDQVKKVIDSFDQIINDGEKDTIRLMIETLIDRIEIDGDNITIYWNFA